MNLGKLGKLVGTVLIISAAIGICYDALDTSRGSSGPWLDSRVVELILAVFAAIAVIWLIAAGARRGQANATGGTSGTFRVYGVDRGTKSDTVRVIQAASAGNAKAKAELDGIVVTDVKRI